MTKVLRALALGAAMLLPVANATAGDLGTLDADGNLYTTTYGSPANDGFGGFLDTISFSLATTSDVLLASYGSATGDLAVLDSNFGILGTFKFGQVFSFDDMAAGSYTIAAFGKASGLGGQAYWGLATPAVPEPETYAMLLAGLGMVMLIVRRRST